MLLNKLFKYIEDNGGENLLILRLGEKHGFSGDRHALLMLGRLIPTTNDDQVILLPHQLPLGCDCTFRVPWEAETITVAEIALVFEVRKIARLDWQQENLRYKAQTKE